MGFSKDTLLSVEYWRLDEWGADELAQLDAIVAKIKADVAAKDDPRQWHWASISPPDPVLTPEITARFDALSDDELAYRVLDSDTITENQITGMWASSSADRTERFRIACERCAAVRRARDAQPDQQTQTYRQRYEEAKRIILSECRV